MRSTSLKIHLARKGSAGIPWSWHVLIFLVCAVAVISRRPDSVLHPAFYAEDGAIWYADAYNLGWTSALILPQGGYLNTFQRLIASLTLLVPLHSAPLVMNLAGITVQVLPVNVLLSSRSAGWGSFPMRLLASLVYILMPNSSEVHIVLTNSQFHLAVLAFVLAVATPPLSALGRVICLLTLLIAGVSGPFCFALLLPVLIVWWIRRAQWYVAEAAVISLGVVVQGYVLIVNAAGRSNTPSGASVESFLKILGGHVYVDAIMGQHFSSRVKPAMVMLIALLGTALMIYCLSKVSLELKLFELFSWILLAGALWKPLVKPGQPAWTALILTPESRYWFIPMLAFLWCVVWCVVEGRVLALRVVAVVILLTTARGLIRNWRYLPVTDFNFQHSVKDFEQAKSGELVTFPIFPGGPWEVRLRKK